jgi:hypothetical protein
MDKKSLRGLGLAIVFSIGPGGSVSAATATFTYDPALVDPLPADFRGKVVYEGSLTGIVTVPSRTGTTINAFGVRTFIPNRERIPVQSSIRVEMEFEGNRVRGTRTFRGNVTGGGPFTGKREGGICQLIDSDDGFRTKAVCTKSLFMSDEDNVNANNQHAQTHSQADATFFIDYAERDLAQSKKNAEEAAKAAKEAAVKKAEKDAEERRLESVFNSLPPVKSTGSSKKGAKNTKGNGG